jgi:predicted thioesterase
VEKITIGATATVSTVVNEHNTAKSVGSGSLEVFATPLMAALMEQAACACLTGCLAEGQTSVGTRISVAHTAATPLGVAITATATIEAVSGRRIDFVVTASDTAGEIGRGAHTRVIVDSGRFMDKLRERFF